MAAVGMGIQSDTLGFKLPTTTPEDRATSLTLLKFAASESQCKDAYNANPIKPGSATFFGMLTNFATAQQFGGLFTEGNTLCANKEMAKLPKTMLSAKSSLKNFEMDDVIALDFKVLGTGLSGSHTLAKEKFCIGNLETLDPNQALGVSKADLVKRLKELHANPCKSQDGVILFPEMKKVAGFTDCTLGVYLNVADMSPCDGDEATMFTPHELHRKLLPPVYKTVIENTKMSAIKEEDMVKLSSGAADPDLMDLKDNVSRKSQILPPIKAMYAEDKYAAITGAMDMTVYPECPIKRD